MSTKNGSTPASPPDRLHNAFLELLPRVERHAKIYFRDIQCPATREDRVAEAVAMAWAWFLRLQERGKDVALFTVVFVCLVAKAVKCGRRLCGQEKARDVMSPLAQQRHDFRVERLPRATSTSHERLYSSPHGQRGLNAFEEMLHDNTATPPDEQAMFRIDFADWLATLTPRERFVIRELARGERTGDVAGMFDVTPGRVSQMRTEFRDGWSRFCGE
jgi:hypothetical protein